MSEWQARRTVSALVPRWPAWDVNAAIGFAIATAVVLFAPKILGGLLVAVQDARRFGGGPGVGFSLLIEMVFSALLAPIRMLFHSQFVLAALTGLHSPWKSPPRDDAETTWGEAIRRHGLHTVVAGVWGGCVYWLDASYAWWLLLPVVGAIVLSIPISVYSSRVSLGRALRRTRLLVIPEETDPPEELRALREHTSRAGRLPSFVDAVVNPRVNAVACAVAGAHVRLSPRAQSRRHRAVTVAVKTGWRQLTNRQKLFLLSDPLALSELHFAVWTSPDAHPTWLAACISGQRAEHSELRLAS